MKREVEIQVKIKSPQKVERKIRQIAKYLNCQKQTDIYFTPTRKNIFKQNPITENIRLRDNGKKLIFYYCHANYSKNKFISTDEWESEIRDKNNFLNILKKIGLKEILKVIKIRKTFSYKIFIISLDQIKNLGYFLEVEAKKIIKNSQYTTSLCFKFLNSLNISYLYNDKIGGYPHQLYHKLRKKK